MHCLLLLPLFRGGGGVWFLLCCAVLSVVSIVLILSRVCRDSCMLYSYCLLVPCDCKYAVSYSHGVVGWSSVYDCGVS